MLGDFERKADRLCWCMLFGKELKRVGELHFQGNVRDLVNWGSQVCYEMEMMGLMWA
jgi:hypothetical protein